MKYLRPYDEKCDYCGQPTWWGRGLGPGAQIDIVRDGKELHFCDPSICYDGWLFKQRGYGLVIWSDQRKYAVKTPLDEEEWKAQHRI